MRTIWKYPFDTTEEFMLEMPSGAQVLTVQVQGGQPCIWALVDPSASLAPRQFLVHGTGHPVTFPHSLVYIGTYQLMGGVIVFHVFEKVQ